MSSFYYYDSAWRRRLEAVIREEKGIVARIVRRMKICRSTFYRIVERVQEIKELLDEVQQISLIDDIHNISDAISDAIYDEEGYVFRIVRNLGISRSEFYRYLEEYPWLKDELTDAREERNLKDEKLDWEDLQQARKNRSDWLLDEKIEVGNACLAMTRLVLMQHAQAKAHEKQLVSNIPTQYTYKTPYDESNPPSV